MFVRVHMKFTVHNMVVHITVHESYGHNLWNLNTISLSQVRQGKVSTDGLKSGKTAALIRCPMDLTLTNKNS